MTGDAEPNPFSPPAAPIDQAAASRYAGLPRRIGQVLVDGLIFLPVVLPLWWLETQRWHTGWIGLGISAGQIAYFVILTAGGATLGMRAVGIRVVDRTGRPPGLARACLRSVLTIAVLAVMTTPHVLYAVFSASSTSPGKAWRPRQVSTYRTSVTASKVAQGANALAAAASGVLILARRDKRSIADLIAATWCVVTRPGADESA